MIKVALSKAINQYKKAPIIYVALSGGEDSVVLLHALTQLSLPTKVVAIHVNHGLSAQAKNWEQLCKALCQALAVDIQICRVNVDAKAKSIEASARLARYDAFEAIINAQAATQTVTQKTVKADTKTTPIILTGHHLSDQAETFLHRLCRGAGLKGLQSIPVSRPVGKAVMIRPLLDTPKSAITAYAKQHELHFVNDESNQDERFTRNFLRHSVLTKLKDKWPACEQNIAKTIGHINEAQTLLDTYLAHDLAACKPTIVKYGYSLNISHLSAFSIIKQKHIIRYWLQTCQQVVPSQAQMLEILKLIKAKQDAQPILDLKHYTLRRYKTSLVCLHVLPDFCRTPKIWHIDQPLALPYGGYLQLHQTAVNHFKKRGIKQLTVGFKEGKVRCKPLGRAHSQWLKKLFQEYTIAPWLRDVMPLVYLDDQILAVGDAWLCEHSLWSDGLLDDIQKQGCEKIVQWVD